MGGSMGKLEILLAETVAVRLCHDLAGPLGGLGAALGEAAEDSEALILAQDAAAALRARLALLRAAWGSAAAALTGEGLRDLAAGLPNSHKLRITLAGAAATQTLPPPASRLAANLLILAAESLPAGGTVTLTTAASFSVQIGGPRAAWPEELAALLAAPDAAWRFLAAAKPASLARRLPLVLTALLAHH